MIKQNMSKRCVSKIMGFGPNNWDEQEDDLLLILLRI